MVVSRASAGNLLVVAMLMTDLDGDVINRDVFALTFITRMLSPTPSAASLS